MAYGISKPYEAQLQKQADKLSKAKKQLKAADKALDTIDHTNQEFIAKWKKAVENKQKATEKIAALLTKQRAAIYKAYVNGDSDGYVYETQEYTGYIKADAATIVEVVRQATHDVRRVNNALAITILYAETLEAYMEFARVETFNEYIEHISHFITSVAAQEEVG